MGGLQAAFRNQGGFHMIGSGRGKIEKAEDLQKAADVAQALRLDGLIVCGGDDSNTNAAVLAESFKSKGGAICLGNMFLLPARIAKVHIHRLTRE